MKNLMVILIGMSFLTSAYGQWVQQNSGTTATLYSVFFTSGSDGCSVGDSGTIVRTTDGGENWTKITSGTTRSLFSVYFTSQDTGYVVGDGGVILKTMNGGSTWNTQSLGLSGYFYLASVHFPAKDTGYATGGNALIKTVDGGLNWIRLDLGNPLYFGNSVFFTDTDTGYIAGCRRVGWDCKAIILKTTNGGESWSICHELDYASGFNSIYFTDSNTGYVLGVSNQFAGESSPISIKTVNAGSDWSGYFEIGGIWPYAMHFPCPDTGYIVGEDWGIVSGEYNIARTVDGGQSATSQFIDTENRFLSVFFIGPDIGYIVGENGMIYKTLNGGGIPVGIDESAVGGQRHVLSPAMPDEGSAVEVYPNPTGGIVDLRFTIYDLRFTTLKVYNAQGQEVAMLLDEMCYGDKGVRWDMGGLPAGVYFYQLRAEGSGQVGVGKIVKY